MLRLLFLQASRLMQTASFINVRGIDASMNDLRFVANARLEKTFLRGRLGVALDGYDIFGGLSNVTKVINAQGIVETWHNSLPSYVMLQISYKLSKGPKKKKESM